MSLILFVNFNTKVGDIISVCISTFWTFAKFTWCEIFIPFHLYLWLVSPTFIKVQHQIPRIPFARLSKNRSALLTPLFVWCCQKFMYNNPKILFTKNIEIILDIIAEIHFLLTSLNDTHCKTRSNTTKIPPECCQIYGSSMPNCP